MSDEEAEAMFARIKLARAAITAKLGKWTKGRTEFGDTDCPVCKASSALKFNRAGLNGHIRARCVTEGCVSWQE